MRSPSRFRSPLRRKREMEAPGTLPSNLSSPSQPMIQSRTPMSRRQDAGRQLACPNKYLHNLHPSMGPCVRCWSMASSLEQKKFSSRGSCLSIVRTKGGCHGICKVFPPAEDDRGKVHLCRNCFYATHPRDGDRLEVYKGRTKVRGKY